MQVSSSMSPKAVRPKNRPVAEAPLAWRLVIGGGRPDRVTSTRFVVHAKDAEDAVLLFRRRGVQGVTDKGVERYPLLDNAPKAPPRVRTAGKGA